MASLNDIFQTRLREHRSSRAFSLAAKADKFREKDKAKAVRLYERAIETGDRVDAPLMIADLVSEDDPERADELYRMAVDSGDAEAPMLYGAFLESRGDLDRAREMYELGVSRGDAEGAGTCLGSMLVGEDNVRACELLQRAREAHATYAPRQLARIAEMDGDYDSAISYCEEAIAAGDEKGKSALGLMVAKGGDVDRAKTLLEEAISDGELEYAPAYLADLLREGEPARAIELYKVSIMNGGERFAAARLASMF